jgi:hypothetical protein
MSIKKFIASSLLTVTGAVDSDECDVKGAGMRHPECRISDTGFLMPDAGLK